MMGRNIYFVYDIVNINPLGRNKPQVQRVGAVYCSRHLAVERAKKLGKWGFVKDGTNSIVFHQAVGAGL